MKCKIECKKRDPRKMITTANRVLDTLVIKALTFHLKNANILKFQEISSIYKTICNSFISDYEDLIIMMMKLDRLKKDKISIRIWHPPDILLSQKETTGKKNSFLKSVLYVTRKLKQEINDVLFNNFHQIICTVPKH